MRPTHSLAQSCAARKIALRWSCYNYGYICRMKTKGPIRTPRDRDKLLDLFRARLTGKRGELAQIAKIMGVYPHHVGDYAAGGRTPWLPVAKRLIKAQDEYLLKPKVVRNPLGCVQCFVPLEDEHSHDLMQEFEPDGHPRYLGEWYYTRGGRLLNSEDKRKNARTIPVAEYIELLKQHYRP